MFTEEESLVLRPHSDSASSGDDYSCDIIGQDPCTEGKTSPAAPFIVITMTHPVSLVHLCKGLCVGTDEGPGVRLCPVSKAVIRVL